MLWTKSTSSSCPEVEDPEFSLAALDSNERFSTQMRMLISFVTFHFGAIWAARLLDNNHAQFTAMCL